MIQLPLGLDVSGRERYKCCCSIIIVMNHFDKIKSASSHMHTRIPNHELRQARRKILGLGLLGVVFIVAGLLMLFTGSSVGRPNASLSQVRAQTTPLPALVRSLQAEQTERSN